MYSVERALRLRSTATAGTTGGKATDAQVQNGAAMRALVDELHTRLHNDALYEGRTKDVRRHHERGQLLARERVELVWRFASGDRCG